MISALLSLVIVVSGSFALYFRREQKLKKYISSRIRKLARSMQIEQLVLMPTKAYYNLTVAILDEYGFENLTKSGAYFEGTKDAASYLIAAPFYHPVEKTTVTTVLKSIRRCLDNGIENLCIISPSGYNEDSLDLAFRTKNIAIELIDQDEFLSLAEKTGFKTSEEDAAKAAMESISSGIVKLETLKNTVISRSKCFSYMLCGILCIVWIILFSVSVLNIVLGLTCFILAFLSFRQTTSK